MHRSSRRSRRAVFGIAGALLAFGVLAAACGSDDSGSSAGTTASGGGAATTASGGAATTAAASTETPVAGGKLVVGIEADTGSPWEPSKMLCATSCYVTIGSVYDTLTSVTEDGKFVPYLADSVTPNADYTVWTFHARDGRQVPRRHAVRRRRHGRQHEPADEVVPHRQGLQTSRPTRTAAPQIVVTDPMTVDDHDEAAMGGLPDLPRRPARLHRPARRG